ncbi:MAG: PHP domain-containing protein, partial [Myxococcales bacterium]|nr:PHP domain-containing protein [Myxococcales bacterium]
GSGRCYDRLIRGARREGEVRVGRYLSTSNMPRGGRARAQVGDYYLQNEVLLVVVRQRDGTIIDIATRTPGSTRPPRDGIGWGTLAVCDSNGTHQPRLVSVQLEMRQSKLVRLIGRIDSEPELAVETRLWLRGARLVIETEIKNDGRYPRYNLRVCDDYGIANVPLQAPGLGEYDPMRAARARHVLVPWVARREGPRSYLLVSHARAPLRLWLGASTPSGAFAPSFDVSYGRFSLRPGRTHTLRRSLVVVRGAEHRALALALAARKTRTREVTVALPTGLVPMKLAARSGAKHGSLPLDPALGGGADLRVEIERDGKPYLVSALDRARSTLTLPARGRYRVALWMRGPGLGPWIDVGADKGGAAKPVVLRAPPYGTLALAVRERRGGPPTPAKVLLAPLAADAKRGAAVDLGNDGWRAARSSYYSDGGGSLRLRPGRYRLLAARGFEHGLARKTVRVRAGKTTRVELVVPRVLPTPGWLAADLHVHSERSFDSPTRHPARLVAAAAVGLELIANTDHNAVTSDARRPTARKLKAFLQSWPGQEVTTSGHRFGHFNAFPLRKPLRYRHTTPKALFAAARAAGALVQANHPRMGSIGYFQQVALDAARARARAGVYHGGYQLLEVFNADYLGNMGHVMKNLREWQALLARGYRYVATGSSDAHRLPVQDYGYPRTMIQWRPRGATSDAADARAPQAAVIDALRRGRAQVTSGPLIDLTVDGKGLGEQIAIAPGKRARVRLRVYAAPWVDVQKAELWIGGKRFQALRAARGGRKTLRIDRTFTVRASDLPADRSFIIALASGDRADPTQPYRTIRPFAFTNPIYLARPTTTPNKRGAKQRERTKKR